MTIHTSLKTKSGSLSQHRNVLTRAERISKLSSQERFSAVKNSPLGIVKVGNPNTTTKKAKAVKAEGDAAAPAAAGAKGAAPAAKAGAAAPGKTAAPAAGAKGAAPAGKAAAPAGGAKKK